MSGYCFGIDVGGTTVKCGLFTSDGEMIEKWEIPTRSENNGSAILPDVAETILAKVKERSLDKSEICGIGVGIPGPVRKGVAAVAVNLHWGEVNVAGILGELTGLPVAVGNDANVAALGEMWKGAAEGKLNVILVTLGTGVGGGFIVDGKIVEGAHGAGGEIGHAHVDDCLTEKCNCGNFGCLEQFASATGIVRLAREALLTKPADEETTLVLSELSAKGVFDAYKRGDPTAARIVNKFAAYLGTALAVFSVAVDPGMIVIGGGVSKAGQPLIDAVEKYYRERAFLPCKDTPIRLATLGNDAGIYGAARLVL